MEDKAKNRKTATLTRIRLAEAIQKRYGESFKLASLVSAKFVDAFFEEICMALRTGENVKLSSFGTFHIRQKPPRIGRNPKTGQSFPIAERKAILFRPSSHLKKRVNSHKTKKLLKEDIS